MAQRGYHQVQTWDCDKEVSEETLDSKRKIGSWKSRRPDSGHRELRLLLQSTSHSEERRAFRGDMRSELAAMATDVFDEDLHASSPKNHSEERRAFRVAALDQSVLMHRTVMDGDTLDEDFKAADLGWMPSAPATPRTSTARRRFFVNAPKKTRPGSMPVARRNAQRALLTGSTRTKANILGGLTDRMQNQRPIEAFSQEGKSESNDIAIKLDVLPPLSRSAITAWENHNTRGKDVDTFSPEIGAKAQTAQSPRRAHSLVVVDCMDEEFSSSSSSAEELADWIRSVSD